MIKVSDEAIKQIKNELANLQVEYPEAKDAYIRLYMTYG